MQRTKPLKEKFVELTQGLFQRDAAYTDDPSTFWDVYLLLDVNADCIANIIDSMSEEALVACNVNLSLLFEACVDHMDHEQTASEKMRQLHAIQLLACLFRALFAKKRLSYFNIIHLLTKLDKADAVFGALIQRIQRLLSQPQTRSWALVLTLVIVSGNDHVNQSNLNGYFMHHPIVSTLVEIIRDPESTAIQQQDAIMVWGLLSNYNKYEIRNEYLDRLHTCKETRVLETIMDILKNTLCLMQRKYEILKDDEETVPKAVVSFMTRWFSQTRTTSPDMDIPASLDDLPPHESAFLLILYELVCHNSHFVAILARTSVSTDNPDEPTLVGSILSFSSYLFQHNRNPRSFLYTRLILLVLLRLSEEDIFLNSMKNENSAMQIRLCRQRPPPLPRSKTPRLFFPIVLDNMLLYIKHNMRKKLDMSTYKVAFSVVHRILCYLRRHKMRLEYHWVLLWPVLTSMLHFIVAHLDELRSREEFNAFISLFICIINLCITHGETFIADTKSYDTLFYEIIRATDDFTTLSQSVSRGSPAKGRGESNGRSNVISYADFGNIRLICNHFNPALEEWQTSHHVTSLTPTQVMNIINENYATLDLAPMDKLDMFSIYNEVPAEMGFFRQVLRTVVSDYSKTIIPRLQ
ncbi:hypothetical protein CLU79DRAFT_761163 [Phycomyces nitens]|nr:hypothetical protein CLU79DRAFT_761163 [Phycomyces nitens]